MDPFPYWTNILWTLFHIELIYCGPFSILNILWTLFHIIELMYCGPFSILNLYIVDPFPYWTYILWTIFRTELMYCGPFPALKWYVVDPFPYWTYILWTSIHIEHIYCGPFSILNLCIVDLFPYWTYICDRLQENRAQRGTLRKIFFCTYRVVGVQILSSPSFIVVA